MQNSFEHTLPTILSDKLPGKQLPAHIEAEKAILGAILLNGEGYHQVSGLLSPNDFYYPPHKTLFEVLGKIVEQSKVIDLITLQDELQKLKLLDKVGGLIYLIELQENIPALGLLTQHTEIVREKAILRELINSAAGIITNCYTQNKDNIAHVIDEAEKTIFKIANRQNSSDSFVQLNIWLKKTFQHLSDIKSHSKGITGLATGYKKLDDMTSGLQKGDLIVLAGRPSMGKSMLGLNIATTVINNGLSAGFFSIEMAAEQLTLRLLSSESGIAHHLIKNATISSDEWVELTNVAARLAKGKLFIDDTAGINIMELRARARKLKMDHKIDLLVIDYLQMLFSPKKYENRHQEVSAISRDLKSLAKELNIPIIALSQLSRAVDSRVDKRPMLSDLRESGAIEQDADLIMFLYRDVVYNPETEHPNQAELIIGKQRNGPTGDINLTFIGELSKFEDPMY